MPTFPRDVRAAGEWLEANEAIDRLVAPVQRFADAALPPGPVADALHGVWLGHPLHPLLTDLPIGFWTSAFLLDLGGRRARGARGAATALVAAGVATAVPTALAGLADWHRLNRPEQRSGVVHAAANATATSLYAASLVARLRGRQRRGVAFALLGSAAATVGGFLGGHLSFRRASSVNHATDAPSPTEWQDAEPAAGEAAAASGLRLLHLDGAAIVVAGTDGQARALADRCSHLGGPLHEGELVDGCVRCPWHGSTFSLDDGSVRRGPATSPQPAYEVRTGPAGVQLRRKPVPGVVPPR